MITEDEYSVPRVKSENPGLSDKELLVCLKEQGAGHISLDTIRLILSSLLESHEGLNLTGKIVVKDRIVDQMFQQLLLRPQEYDVIATPNLNEDYLSDAARARWRKP